MKKELGKWLMDVAKYMVTALLLSSVFGEMDKPLMILLVTIGTSLALFSGLILIDSNDKKENKLNSRSNNKKKGK